MCCGCVVSYSEVVCSSLLCLLWVIEVVVLLWLCVLCWCIFMNMMDLFLCIIRFSLLWWVV